MTNAATRVLAILQKAKRGEDKQSATEVWANVFGIDPQTAKRDPHEVYAKLQLVRSEIEAIDSLMKSTAIPANLVTPYLERVRRVVSPTSIGSPWLGYKQTLTGETILCLQYCAAILSSEGEISQEELQGILDQVHALRKEILESKLSNAVQDFILRQLDIIECSIHEYPICGEASIRRAFKDGFTDLASHVDDLKNHQDIKEVGKVARIWGTLKQARSSIVESDRFATAFVNLLEKGGRATEALGNAWDNLLPS